MNKRIDSPANPRIRDYAKLKRKKYRDREGLYLIETKKLLEEALSSGVQVVESFCREDVKPLTPQDILLSKRAFAELTDLETPDGYLAVCKKEKEGEAATSNRILILDRIQDPGNLGTMLRSAEAFGFGEILAIQSVDYYNLKVLRASMGSAFRLNLRTGERSDVEALKEEGYVLIGADMGGIPYKKSEVPKKAALLIGNEGQGLDPKLRPLLDLVVSIPMQGRIESLNAAISASVLMNHYEA